MKFWTACVGWLGRSISFVLQISPPSFRRGLGSCIGLLWFDVLQIRRKVVLSNLDIAFPELTENERVRIARRSMINFGLTIVEYSALPFLTQDWVPKNCSFEGLEHLDSALAKKKGVCLLTLHLGNGDLAISSLSLLGYPMTLISKEFSLRWLNDLWFGMRQRLGTKFIAPRNSSLAVSRALKNNEVVIFVLDQFTGPPIGTRSLFFGRETGTGLGLATMAKRRDCPVIPCYTYRDSKNRHRICFDPAMSPIEEGASLEDLTQDYNDRLESFVRKVPEQWMWLHRRWKVFHDTRTEIDPTKIESQAAER